MLIIQSIEIELKIWFFDEIDTKSYIRNMYRTLSGKRINNTV